MHASQSTNPSNPFDVVVVGASMAGCTAALLYARQGLRVALVERGAMDDFKLLCSHLIQSPAVPILQQLGLYQDVMDAGAVQTQLLLHSRWGDLPIPYLGTYPNLNFRRELLDPILRTKAGTDPQIQCFWQRSADELIETDGQVCGVRLRASTETDGSLELLAPLVVAADGRSSPLAKMAGAKAYEVPNQRFSFFAYYRGLPRDPRNRTHVWLRDHGAGYVAAFPNDSDLTLVSSYVPERQFAQWQGQVEARYLDYVAQVQGGPDLSRGERVGEILGKRRAPSLYRNPIRPGLAFVGDAALAMDPLVGIGCSWALESAQMLVQATAGALQTAANKLPLQAALQDYRRRHLRYFGPQFALLSRFSKAKSFNPLTSALLYGATKFSTYSQSTKARPSALAR